MNYEKIQLEVEGPLAILTLDRPEALNALDTRALQEMEHALRTVAENRELRALIVTGRGEHAFGAGADVGAMIDFSAEEAREFSGLGQRVFAALEALRVPTIAAVNGLALGGGCELALACDLLYASENAKFGLPEVSMGIIPAFGGTQRLTRLVGRSRAKELIFTADPISAEKACEVGLVLDVVPPGKLMEHCRRIAAQILKRAPLAVSQAKRVVELGADQHLSSANELERQASSSLFGTHDQQEGMKAFLENRTPRFKAQ